MDANTPTSATKAVKDKSCQFCGQAFTSSSLGRHLDLYIKAKNPKPPDGIHDVDAIRKLRENITRRQPRGSLARRETSTSVGTPASKKSPAVDDGDESIAKSPAIQLGEGIGRQYPFNTPWEATGVIMDIPKSTGSDSGRTGEGDGSSTGGASADLSRTPVPLQRSVSRQMMKAQFDMKQKMQDAMDTSKAAELALREIVSSLRAAKQQFDMKSMPFEFDPLALDFPALTLQCLPSPPTLFSSTQHPTPTSWSILPPGHQQFEALRLWFAEEFRKWRISCQAATTTLHDDLSYPPAQTNLKPDGKDAVLRAEKVADGLETQVNEHIQTMYNVWEGLNQQRRQELWILELARAVGRKQKEVETLKESEQMLKQENANLKTQIDQLNRLQQPREFKIMSPQTLPVDRKMLNFFQEEGIVHGRRTLAFSYDDRNNDLGTVVSTAIDRWKQVIVASRSSSGLNAQRALNKPGTPDVTSAASSTTNQAPAQPHTQMQQHPSMTQQNTQSASMAAGGNAGKAYAASAYAASAASAPGPTSSVEEAPPSASTTGHISAPVSVSVNDVEEEDDDEEEEDEEEDGNEEEDEDGDQDYEMSDQDADAEMEDDDGYANMNAQPQPTASRPQVPQAQQQVRTQRQQPVNMMPAQQTTQLEVPRARPGHQQFAAAAAAGNARSVTHGTIQGGRGTANMTNRSMRTVAAMPNHMNQRHHVMVQNHSNHSRAAPADMGMMHGISGEPMYMD